jgi:hypothetical protein
VRAGAATTFNVTPGGFHVESLISTYALSGPLTVPAWTLDLTPNELHPLRLSQFCAWPVLCGRQRLAALGTGGYRLGARAAVHIMLAVVSDLRRLARHGHARPAGHRQAHPRRHAGAVEYRRVPRRAAALGHPAQPARVQGRHREPRRGGSSRRRRAAVDARRLRWRASLGVGRVLSGHQDHQDAGGVLGSLGGIRERGGTLAPGARHRYRRH